MAHEKVYGVCENKCKVEVYPKTQAVAKADILKLTFDSINISAGGSIALQFTNSNINANTVYLGCGYSYNGVDYIYSGDKIRSQNALSYYATLDSISVDGNTLTVNFENNDSYDVSISGWIKVLCV